MDAEVSLTDLPDALLLRVFEAFDAESLARTGCTCRDLANRSSQALAWKEKCYHRWQRRDTDTWRKFVAGNAYKKLYAKKHQLDKSARELVLKLQHDKEQYSHNLLKIYTLGSDVLEVLLRDAANRLDRPGAAELTKEALFHIQVRRATEAMSSLVYRNGNNTKALLDEGSLLLAQCHYPCSDLSPVSRFLDDLAAELLRRMNAANVSGGEAALRLLTQLLFASDDGPAADERYARWWPQGSSNRDWVPVFENELRVPTLGGSLNLRGNREHYNDARNSLLPAVLLCGRGIPLTLCIIHAAVARRAGLNVFGVNMPAHFVNKFEEEGVELFIDCFNGGHVSNRDELLGNLGGLAQLHLLAPNRARFNFEAATPRDVWIRVILNTQNAYAEQTHQFVNWINRSRVVAACGLLMCGILRTFTRQPYYIQQADTAEKLECFDETCERASRMVEEIELAFPSFNMSAHQQVRVVLQEVVTDYVMLTWPDGADLLPWVLPGSLSLAPRDMNESLR